MNTNPSQEEIAQLKETLKTEIEKDKDKKNVFRQRGLDLHIDSIKNIRKWTFEMLTISSAILGVFIAVGSTSPMVKHKEFLTYAFFCFILAILYGFAKLKEDIEKDINEIPKFINEICERQARIIKAKEDFLLNFSQEGLVKCKEAVEKEINEENLKWPKREKRIYSFDIIYSLFFIGLVLIGYSIRYRFGILLSCAFLFFVVKFWSEELNYYKGQQVK